MNRPTLNFGNSINFVKEQNPNSPITVPPVPASPALLPIKTQMPTSSELSGQAQEVIAIDDNICFSNNAIAQPAISDIKYADTPAPSTFGQINTPAQETKTEIKPDLIINENPTSLIAPKRRTRKPKAETVTPTAPAQESNNVTAPDMTTLNPTAVIPESATITLPNGAIIPVAVDTIPLNTVIPTSQPMPDISTPTVAPNANLIKTDAVNIQYVVEGANQAIKIMAEDTEFTIDTNTFKAYLDKISLNGVIKDAVISVCSNFLFARYSEPITRYISGLITLPMPVNTVQRTGTMIISNLDELIKVMKQFQGQIKIEYSKGKLILTEIPSNMSAELLGAASAFVSSMKSAIKLVHDPVAKTLSGINYGAMNNFVISPSDLQSVASAASAINLDFFTFDISAKQVNTISTNRQKAFKMSLKAKNINVHTPMQVSFYITLANICKLYKTDLTFYIQQNSMIMTDGVDYYLMLTCGK